jgi:hypothetical protein
MTKPEKALVRMRIDEHLIIPFGRPKWDISKIRLVGVSTGATYFESDTPCVYIAKSKAKPLRLADFASVFPDRFSVMDDEEQALEFIRSYIRTDCQLQTPSETEFLDLYFKYLQKAVTPWPGYKDTPREKHPVPTNDPDWMFAGLMPLPQAHLYLEDPLSSEYTYVPQWMVKVDFAFWTGKRIVAVEIDGGSHIGNENHIRKDRMLQRAGVLVIHILNEELNTHGVRALERLLPRELTRFWEGAEKLYFNPLGDPFALPF